MRVILIAFALLFVFFLSSRVKLSHTEDAPHHLLNCIFENFPWEFAVAIFRENLPWGFAAGICRENLPSLFAVGFLYIYANPFLHIWANLVYIETNLLYVCKTFWFVRFSLLTVFLLVIVVVAMGHRTFKVCVALFS